jgi:hypothetical protein
MKTATLACALSASLLLAGSPAQSADLAGAKAFLVQVYAHYPQRRGGPEFDPTGRSAPAVFDPGLVSLFREDVRLTPQGDEGAIDSDPICHCQDDSGMVATVEAVTPAGPSQASARVRLRFTAARPVETVRLDLDLVTVQGQWRIHDIHAKDQSSFRAMLEESVRLERRAHH